MKSYPLLLLTALLLSACTPAIDLSETDLPVTETVETAPAETVPETALSELIPETALPETVPAETDVPLSEAVLLDPHTGEPIPDVTLTVAGDRAVVGVPLLLSDAVLKNAAVRFMMTDGTLTEPCTVDLTGETAVELPDGEGGSILCTVTGERRSHGLTVLAIETDGGVPIAEKNTYIHGVLKVNGREFPLQIKGRGNASWNMFPKKSYRLKLDEGAPLFALPKNRDWVLTSGYADKSLIRNCVAHTVAASLSGLDYTPTHIPVHLYLNGEYMGVYTFGDKIEDGNGRLELGESVVGENGVEDVGFLLEIGWDFDEENFYNRDYFDTERAFRVFVKEPEVTEPNSPEYLIVKNYILRMERAIMTDDGWEDYIDVDSWVDWFIVNELTFNTESSYYRSCYLWRPVGGKVHMGPVWDFDMAFGNHLGDLRGYDGWCTTESTYEYISRNWMNELMTYPAFTERLAARWNEVKDELLTVALSAVEEYSAMLAGSAEANFQRWDILGVRVGMGAVDPAVYDTYEKQVEYVKEFIETRWAYMDERLNSDEVGVELGIT